MTTETEGAAQAVAEDTSAAITVTEEAPAEAHVEEFEGEGEPEPEPEPEAEKPKKTAKDRINELVREREDARREADFWKGKAQPEPKPAEDAAPVASAEDAKPDPNDYEFGAADERYIEDLADWKVDQRLKEHTAAQEGRAKFKQSLDTFHDRAKEQFPEGEPEGLKAFKALPDAGSIVLQQMVIDSDVGPKLADHFGTNPADIKRISGLHPLDQAREIGKLEARFAAGAQRTPVKTVSDAPAPPANTVRGAGGKFAVAPDTSDFASFDRAYGNG